MKSVLVFFRNLGWVLLVGGLAIALHGIGHYRDEYPLIPAGIVFGLLGLVLALLMNFLRGKLKA